MLKVVTLNIGSLLDPGWDERRSEVVAWLDRCDADVVCMQEVWSEAGEASTAHWVAERTATSYQVVFGGHSLGSLAPDNPELRYGSAILSRWPIDDHDLWALPTADDSDDPMPAAMPWELLHARTAGLDIFSTHLAPAPVHGRHRVLQVLEIDRLIRSVRGDSDRLAFPERRVGMPAILCGDFNAEPESDEIRFLKGLTVLDDRTTFFQDAWAVAGDDSPGYTSDWRTHPLSDRLNIHRKRIDYVFVGDPFYRAENAGRVLRAEVIADEPLTGVQASDHMGVSVDVVWPGRPTS